jgi:hypothetical protein
LDCGDESFLPVGKGEGVRVWVRIRVRMEGLRGGEEEGGGVDCASATEAKKTETKEHPDPIKQRQEKTRSDRPDKTKFREEMANKNYKTNTRRGKK